MSHLLIFRKEPRCKILLLLPLYAGHLATNPLQFHVPPQSSVSFYFISTLSVT
jgi:hypothetical protein